MIRIGSDEEAQEVVDRSRQITMEMAQMPGFISLTNSVVGHSLFTTSAWEDVESAAQLLQGGAHKEAMRRFSGPTSPPVP